MMATEKREHPRDGLPWTPEESLLSMVDDPAFVPAAGEFYRAIRDLREAAAAVVGAFVCAPMADLTDAFVRAPMADLTDAMADLTDAMAALERALLVGIEDDDGNDR